MFNLFLPVTVQTLCENTTPLPIRNVRSPRITHPPNTLHHPHQPSAACSCASRTRTSTLIASSAPPVDRRSRTKDTLTWTTSCTATSTLGWRLSRVHHPAPTEWSRSRSPNRTYLERLFSYSSGWYYIEPETQIAECCMEPEPIDHQHLPNAIHRILRYRSQSASTKWSLFFAISLLLCLSVSLFFSSFFSFHTGLRQSAYLAKPF